MKKILNDSKLQMCDVILTTADVFISKKIRLYTDSDISHAMIYVTSHSIIDSTGEGVHSRSTQRLIWPENCGVHVLRLKAQLSFEQERQITNFARQKIGTQYATLEAGSTLRGGRKAASRKQFCSRLVAQSYASAGIKVVDNPDFCTPADLLRSDLFEEIEDVTMRISDKFEKTVKGIPDTTKVMMDATNKLLAGARKIDSSIQDSNDMDAYLIKHPEHDKYFASLYRESGYLTVWEFEYNKSSWQYDLNGMLQAEIPEKIKFEYCTDLVNDGGEGGHRFETNLIGYHNYHAQFPLETFSILLELYKKLYELYITRKDTAKKWLLLNSQKIDSDGTWELVPHTDEWFTALTKQNELQASHVRQVLQLAGANDVCSLCGDNPAEDYLLTGDKVPGFVYTLRLCQDCLVIRQQQLGESYILLNS